MSRTTVGVLRGGTSNEYDLSLKTGAAMLAQLPEERYEARDIFIDKNGLWYRRGIPSDPARALAQVDVVLNGLHGGVGEDGSVQRILDRAGVRYAGSRARAAALAHHKARAREALQRVGVRMPQAFHFTLSGAAASDRMARQVFSVFGPPYVLKPASESGGHGIRIAPTLSDLGDAIADMLEVFGGVIVEEFVRGREATVVLLEDFRNEELYALPPSRVALPPGEMVMHSAIRPVARHVSPSDFTYAEKSDLMAVARAAHRALELSHFSRADIIVNARGVPFLLEVNTTPKLHPEAALPDMLEAVGSSVPEFLEHQIRLARNA